MSFPGFDAALSVLLFVVRVRQHLPSVSRCCPRKEHVAAVDAEPLATHNSPFFITEHRMYIAWKSQRL